MNGSQPDDLPIDFPMAPAPDPASREYPVFGTRQQARAKLRHAADVLNAQMMTCPGCGSRVAEVFEISSGKLGVKIQRCRACLNRMAGASGVTLE